MKPQYSERQKAQLAELAKKQSDEHQAALLDNKFPADFLDLFKPHNLQVVLRRALQHTTPQALQCPREVYAELATVPLGQMNLQTFGFACNCIEMKTPHQLEVTLPEYAELLETLGAIGKQWEAIVAALQEPINAKYKGLVERINQNKAILIP